MSNVGDDGNLPHLSAFCFFQKAIAFAPKKCGHLLQPVLQTRAAKPQPQPIRVSAQRHPKPKGCGLSPQPGPL